MFSDSKSLVFLTMVNALVLTRDIIETVNQFLDGELSRYLVNIATALAQGVAP